MTVNETAKSASNYAQVNGLNLYYEIHGEGEPLILLHGGLGSGEMFGEILQILSQSRKIITVDLQAHGRTADVDRPISFQLMAEDIAALIEHLHFEKANVMGYSLGGGVALRTAIQHPDKIKKLVVVSTTFRQNGWYPEVLAGMAQMSPQTAESMKQTPMYQNYAKIAPRPQDWPILLSKMGELLRQDYDWSKEVAEMHVPTMIVVGDSDAICPSHAVEFFEFLGGGKHDAGWDGSGMPSSRLAILPGITHYSIFSSPVLANTVTIQFLDAAMPKNT